MAGIGSLVAPMRLARAMGSGADRGRGAARAAVRGGPPEGGQDVGDEGRRGSGFRPEGGP